MTGHRGVPRRARPSDVPSRGRWTWSERARRIRQLVFAGWALYSLCSIVIILMLLHGPLIMDPILFGGLLLAFVGPPAWIQLLWVNAPGYLCMSSGIREIGLSDVVRAQISRESNASNDLGVPRLPTELCTPTTDLSASSVAPPIAAVRIPWDEYLLNASALLYPDRAFPARVMTASVELGSDALIVSAGRWRPGVLLELSYSSVVGVWNGSEIPTVDSDGVAVVVVTAGSDEVLFAFEPHRGANGRGDRTAVSGLIRAIDGKRPKGSA